MVRHQRVITDNLVWLLFWCYLALFYHLFCYTSLRGRPRPVLTCLVVLKYDARWYATSGLLQTTWHDCAGAIFLYSITGIRDESGRLLIHLRLLSLSTSHPPLNCILLISLVVVLSHDPNLTDCRHWRDENPGPSLLDTWAKTREGWGDTCVQPMGWIPEDDDEAVLVATGLVPAEDLRSYPGGDWPGPEENWWKMTWPWLRTLVDYLMDLAQLNRGPWGDPHGIGLGFSRGLEEVTWIEVSLGPVTSPPDVLCFLIP